MKFITMSAINVFGVGVHYWRLTTPLLSKLIDFKKLDSKWQRIV